MNSPHNSCGYYTIYGDDSLRNDHFNARLLTGDTQTTFARTGYLGFIKRTDLTQADGGNTEQPCMISMYIIIRLFISFLCRTISAPYLI